MKDTSSRFKRWLLVSPSIIYPLLFCVSTGFSQAPFYQGKIITILQGRDTGGTGDLRVRAVAQFLQKYIPGNPTISYEYMPGGGGLRAANHIYAGARADGLTIGNVSSGMLGSAVLGGAGVKYQVEKFFYLGAADAGGQYAFYTRKEAGFNSLERLRAAPGVRVGAQAVAHSNYNLGRLAAYLLPLKEPRFVTGYSSPELDVALMRGEIDARFSQIHAVLQDHPEWVDRGLIDFHVVLQIPKEEKHPRFGYLPELETFARNEREHELVTLQRGFRIIGSPFILPPATPREQVTILQQAMVKVFRDPEFPKVFKKMVGEDADIVMPDVMEKAIKELPRSPEVVELLKKIAGPGELPPR